MSTLPALREVFNGCGRNHVQFNGTDCVKTTSNFFTRWFNRVCAYFFDSEKKKNQDVCTAFLEIIKNDSVYGCMYDDAQKKMRNEGRIGTGKPLSGRKAMKVLDSLFKKSLDRRAEEIRQYKQKMCDFKSDLFLGKIINDQPKISVNLPIMNKFIKIYAVIVGGEIESVNPTHIERDVALDQIDRIVMKRIEGILKEQITHRTQPFTDGEIRSVAIRALIERELSNAHLDPRGDTEVRRRANYDSLLTQCNRKHIEAPSIEDYIEEVKKAIEFVAVNWESRPELVAKVQPDKFNQRYLQELLSTKPKNVLNDDPFISFPEESCG